jgi:hypothetical protein
MICYNVIDSRDIKDAKVNFEMNDSVNGHHQKPVVRRKGGKRVEHRDGIKVISENGNSTIRG